jgi:hypothetical protein
MACTVACFVLDSGQPVSGVSDILGGYGTGMKFTKAPAQTEKTNTKTTVKHELPMVGARPPADLRPT